MKQSILATSLCGVLLSPVVTADDAQLLEELQKTCYVEFDTEKGHAECKAFVRDLKVLSKKPAKGMANRLFAMANKYGGVCTDFRLQASSLSREGCLKYVADKTPDCERLYLSSHKPGIENIFLFIECIQPARACNEANIKDDKSWREHCEELAWDAKG